MLEIVLTSKCKKDLKTAKKRGLDLDEFFDVVTMLQKRETLPSRYKDHALAGDKRGLRDCHIRLDWVLIYKVDDEKLILLLVETGTHSDLGL